jgi:DNA (cytosine-5)-methyltransferase 1
LYYQVLNAKKHGVPQNRERIFLIGIRDDQDNRFQFPKEEYLSKRLKDVLENNANDKYFLSKKMINGFLAHNKRHIEEKGQDGFNWKPKDENDIAACLRANAALAATDNTLKIKSATLKGYEEAKEGDSINFSVLNSETRRGRVGKGVAQTLDTACNQATLKSGEIRRLTPRECFRLMDFPDTFTWPVSDSQAYKQAGNSIVVNVLYKILKQLPL